MVPLGAEVQIGPVVRTAAKVKVIALVSELMIMMMQMSV
jgi:hypothetical protein